MDRRRVGIVGFGHLGQYLLGEIQKQQKLEVAFVWNRSVSALLGKVETDVILTDLADFKDFAADVIVEVAHPSVTHEHGTAFLAAADFMIGSPTAMAVQVTETSLRQAAQVHGLYVPSGAFWGGQDIKKMADRGSLQAVGGLHPGRVMPKTLKIVSLVAALPDTTGISTRIGIATGSFDGFWVSIHLGQALKVTMKKHPASFKLEGELAKLNKSVTDGPVTLYEGSVRALCPLAPNNVNTMATAAIAAHNLGFDCVQGCLVSDPSLANWHIVEVEAWGPGDITSGTAFHTHTVRRNPATLGEVTGSATYASFLSSLLEARGKGPGVHLC